MTKRREQSGEALYHRLISVSKVLVALIRRLALPLLILLAVGSAAAQTTAFSYQGKLTDSGNLANGSYDFQFKLFDTVAVGTGTQQGTTVTVSNITVSNGSFTAQLDFGACASCFNGAARFLEIAVKPISGSTFTTLGPRQPITSNPYAVRSATAGVADTATTANGLSVACVNCVTSSQIQSVQGSQITGNIAGSQINGVIPVASVPAGSANYIQNSTIQQAATNFNISGNGVIGGRLGIGTTAPATLLHIKGVEEGIRIEGPATGNANLAYVSFVDSTGTRIGYVGDGSTGDRNTFLASDLGNVELLTQAGRVLTATSTGRVGIGTTAPLTKLEVDGGNDNAVFGFSTSLTGVEGSSTNGFGVEGSSTNGFAGFFSGSVHVTGTLSQGSDARLKQDISPLGYGLAELLRLRPVTWRWKDRPERGLQLGLVAQEVEPVLPELVSEDKTPERIKGLNYTGLLPVLINAIKEQQKRLEQQQANISQQQQQLEQYRTQLAQQQQEMAAIKQLLCQSQPQADLCKVKTAK